MYTININEEVDSAEAAAALLEEIVKQLRKGNTSGFYPTWNLEKNN